MYTYQLISKLTDTYVTLLHTELYSDVEFIEIYNSALTELELDGNKDDIISQVVRYLVYTKGFSYLSTDIKLYNDKCEARLATKDDVVNRGIIDIT